MKYGSSELVEVLIDFRGSLVCWHWHPKRICCQTG